MGDDSDGRAVNHSFFNCLNFDVSTESGVVAVKCSDANDSAASGVLGKSVVAITQFAKSQRILNWNPD